jgi:PAS domain S-box-containing protein
LLTTISSSLAVLGLILAENAGMLPDPDYTVNITQWITYTVLFGLTGALTYFSYQSTLRALKRAFKERDDRKRAEEVLRESQQEYQSLFENSPISLWLEDLSEVKKYIDNLRKLGVEDFREYFENNRKDVEKCAFLVRVVDVNMTTLELYKAKSKEDFFKGLGVVFDEESYDAFREQLIVVSEGKTSFESEAVNRTFTGEKIYVTLKWTVAPGSEKTYSKVFVSIIDITERMQAEEALYNSEERFKSLSNASFEAIFISENGICIDQNQTAEKMFGYTNSEAVGRQGAEWIVPEDHERVMSNMLSGYEEPYEVTALRKDGTTFPAEIQARMAYFQNRKVRITALKDIRIRKQAEEALRESEDRYREVVENVADIIYTLDGEGKFVFVNKSLERFFGYRLDDILNRNFRDFITPRSYELSADIFGRMLDGEDVGEFDVEFYDKEGNVRITETKMQLVWDGNRVVGLHGIGRDVTERKKLEEQLIRAQKMEALGTLTGGIVHDFNNILSTVLGYASFLKKKSQKGDPFYKGLDAIEKSSLRASDLTAQLLAYTLRGKHEVKPVNMNRIVKEVYDLITKTFDKSIKIDLVTDRKLKTVEGDVSQLNQVVMNIAVNAQNAMPRGGTFEIETYMEKVEKRIEKGLFYFEPGNYVCMKFTDAGIGMDKETIKRIFEPYYTTRGDKGGTGLGMSVVFGIVKGHDGYIDVESNLGEGTAIIVYLPASKKKEEILEKEIEETLGGTETILIIDDEKSILEMTKDFLKESGYVVHTASSGKTGLKTFKTKDIDIVVLDIKMPEMDGREVLEKLLEIDSKAKVLLSSGFSEEDQHHGLIEMGAVGFIGKPFVMDKLLIIIRKVLN